jgi:hypothetical protein
MITNEHTYFDIYSKLYNAFIDPFVIQNQIEAVEKK